MLSSTASPKLCRVDRSLTDRTYTWRVAEEPLSEAIQHYLREIYKLGADDGRVSVTAISRAQGVSPASASALVKKLAALGLADHAPYPGPALTAAGERGAPAVISPPRLLGP